MPDAIESLRDVQEGHRTILSTLKRLMDFINEPMDLVDGIVFVPKTELVIGNNIIALCSWQ